MKDRDVQRFWSKVSLPTLEGCMLWLPDARRPDGYAEFRTGRRTLLAHRVSLELADGEPPEDRQFALHGCRNRDCVAPEHLRWGNAIENMADKLRDGTDNRGERHGNHSLTVSAVEDIRRREVSQHILAARYGVSQSAISLVQSGRRWAHL